MNTETRIKAIQSFIGVTPDGDIGPMTLTALEIELGMNIEADTGEDMRSIHTVIVHCSATTEGQDIGVDEIRSWHKARGWSDIGYHYVIRRDGSIETGRPLSRRGSHAKGHNHGSVGICMVGGIDANNKQRAEANFSFIQYVSLSELVAQLQRAHPIVKVIGHNQVAAKACPCFDVPAFFSKMRK